MEEHLKNEYERMFTEMVKYQLEFCDMVVLLVPTENDWSLPLPEDVLKAKHMVLALGNWSLEETTFNDEGIQVVVAFGEVENTKFFKWEMIKAILMENGTPLLVKPYDYEPKPEGVKVELSLKDIMHPETEGLKHSRSKLKKLNPKRK